MKAPGAELAEERPAEAAMQAARQSEFDYFRAGAAVETGPGWLVAQMPGLEHIPSASFGFWQPARDDGAGDDAGDDANSDEGTADWAAVAAIEAAFRRLRARQSRFYTDDAAPVIAEELGAMGYRRRREIAFLGPAVRPDPSETDLEMCAVASEADWAAKRALHESSDRVSDGHRARARDWVALERRKAETGAITCYLFKQEGEVVATAGLMRPVAGTMRLKNLFVGADHRGKRLGRAMLEGLAERARLTHRCRPVIYAVEGSVGEKLYLSAGFRPIGSVYEWMREKPSGSP